MLHLVSKERQERLEASKSAIDITGLLGEALIMAIAYSRVAPKYKEIHYLRNKYGKPYILELPSFQFNISHTNQFLAIALSKDPVGIDIEEIKSADLRIAKRFFSKGEQDYVFGSPHEQNLRFYEVWTQKEAYVKYLGCGFCEPIANINVDGLIASGHLLKYTTTQYYISVFRHNNREKFDFYELSNDQIVNMICSFA